MACWRRLDSCPPGISWRVDPAGRGGQPGLERRVELAHGLPVGLEVADGLQVEPGGARGVVGGGDERATATAGGSCPPSRRSRRRRRRRPASIAASRVAELAAGGVVGVQVHRQVEPLAQRGDQGARRRRAQQPGHVLDREDVRPGLDDLLGEAAGSSRGCRASRRVWSGRRCSRARPRRPPCRSRGPRRSPGASGRRR